MVAIEPSLSVTYGLVMDNIETLLVVFMPYTMAQIMILSSLNSILTCLFPFLYSSVNDILKIYDAKGTSDQTQDLIVSTAPDETNITPWIDHSIFKIPFDLLKRCR